jgi:hypothetical protein
MQLPEWILKRHALWGVLILFALVAWMIETAPEMVQFRAENAAAERWCKDEPMGKWWTASMGYDRCVRVRRNASLAKH